MYNNKVKENSIFLVLSTIHKPTDIFKLKKETLNKDFYAK